MKRSKKKYLRYFYISSGILIGLLVFLATGLFFIFGEDAIDAVSSFMENIGISGDKDSYNKDIPREVLPLDSSGGIGASGENSDGSGEVFVCNEWQPIQYAIGNFVENIECLVYGIGVCDKVKMTCGAEIFNLDNEIGGNFGIRFSLYEGNNVSMGRVIAGDEIGFEVIEEEIAAREKIMLMSEVVVDGEFDMGTLKCVVDSDFVPQKCIG